MNSVYYYSFSPHSVKQNGSREPVCHLVLRLALMLHKPKFIKGFRPLLSLGKKFSNNFLQYVVLKAIQEWAIEICKIEEKSIM